jgi:ElaB/YqjD/DUF883 family membrane-anchored ribosome-binding protein
MSGKTEASAEEKIDRELTDLRAEVERLTKALAKANEAIKEDVGEAAETLRERAGELKDNVNEKAQEGWEELQAQISEKPVQSLILAFGVGFVLSRLIAR